MEKLFVLVRKDLPTGDQAVQAGHAVAQWVLDNPGHEWKNHTLVYLHVRDLDHLNHWGRKLDLFDYPFTEFFEPDIGDQKTAIACFTGSEVFKNLRLLS